ncbi:class I SAM-dependent methyltransferase [Planctomycetota bacterium]|nr:class I SAM-dependent methyltransferase [Planctomycetota bacterium]
MIQRDDQTAERNIKSDEVSSPDEIRRFFSENTDMFSDPNQIMPALMDGKLCLEMIASNAVRQHEQMDRVLDLGCGGGIASSVLLDQLRFARGLRPKEKVDVDLTLIDLSDDMLKNAEALIRLKTTGKMTVHCADIRDAVLPLETYDVILCSMVLHHLRDEREWLDVFLNLHAALKPGGSLFIYDLIDIVNEQVNVDMRERYSDYLCDVVDEAYRDFCFEHIKVEDTPRPLLWQIEQLQKVGFREVDVLHKHQIYAAFYAIK